MLGVVADIDDRRGGAVVASGTTTVIVGPWKLGKRLTKSFSLYNCHPSITLSGAILEINPDPEGADDTFFVSTPGQPQPGGPNPQLWHTYDNVTFQAIAPGECRSVVANDLFMWWRIRGVNNSNSLMLVSGFSLSSSI